MPFKLERRTRASRLMLLASPLIAVLLSTVAISVLLFVLNKPVGATLHSFFIAPFENFYSITEVFLKFGPLLLIAQALAVGFRAKVWNIGAEGQMIIGAIAASAVPVYFVDSTSGWLLPGMIVLGALGGMAWAAIAAFLKTRFNANEILVTLMLTSIALQLLYYLLLGPWKDPMGFNFPQTVMFQNEALFEPLFSGVRLNTSIVIPIAFTIAVWLFMEKHFGGFKLVVGGLAPSAATYAGFSAKKAVWVSLLLAGFAAGLAGMSEVAGPIGQLQRSVTSGYGYSAIIVAYLGALNPIGIVFAAFFVAVLQIGGDVALVSASLPISAVHVFQGLLLIFYLAAYTLVNYQFKAVRPAARSTPGTAS
ncbi:MAG: ABC transporter permease [Pseudomonadota bacterium]